MITIAGFSGALGAAAIAGVLIATTSDHRFVGVPASGLQPVPCADGNPSARGLPSKGW